MFGHTFKYETNFKKYHMLTITGNNHSLKTLIGYLKGLPKFDVDEKRLLNKLSILPEEDLFNNDEFIDLIEYATHQQILFEGDLEKYFIRMVSKDEEDAVKTYNLLQQYTDESGIFIYDYRVIKDFYTYIHRPGQIKSLDKKTLRSFPSIKNILL